MGEELGIIKESSSKGKIKNGMNNTNKNDSNFKNLESENQTFYDMTYHCVL